MTSERGDRFSQEPWCLQDFGFIPKGFSLQRPSLRVLPLAVTIPIEMGLNMAAILATVIHSVG